MQILCHFSDIFIEIYRLLGFDFAFYVASLCDPISRLRSDAPDLRLGEGRCNQSNNPFLFISACKDTKNNW